MSDVTTALLTTKTFLDLKAKVDAPSIWKGSLFEPFKLISSPSAKGSAGEHLVREYLAAQLKVPARSKTRQGDFYIGGHEVEVKTSTCWNDVEDFFCWQQIRNQDYDRIVFLGINPNSAVMYWAEKADLEKHIFGTNLYRQHAGQAGGQELYWIKSSRPYPSFFRDMASW